MTASGFCLFETPVGACGIAWGDAGIAGVQLPEGGEERARARLARRFPSAVEKQAPPPVREAIDAILRLLSGKPEDLSFVILDMGGIADFERRVYGAARQVPAGETVTYGELAGRIGEPRAAQAVGKALGRNPFPIIVPCHRVLGASGKTGGFSARGGIDTKLRILSIEKARTSSLPSLFDDLPLVARSRD